MDEPSPDPIERIAQLAASIEGRSRDPEAALGDVAAALRLIAEQLDARRNPQ
jgi:hypothetical protein